MEEMKFASKSEAINHLSEVTGKNIKIAWSDQSKSLLKDVAKEVEKSPSTLLKLTKGAGLDFKQFLSDEDKDAKILPTSKGSIKIVQDVDPKVIQKAVDKLKNPGNLSERGKILDYVQANKEEFPSFHQKHKKGIQKDDKGPYYRSKGGLLSRGMEKLTGEDKGEDSPTDKAAKNKEMLKKKKIREDQAAEDKAAEDKTKEERTADFNLIIKQAKGDIGAMLSKDDKSRTKRDFIALFDKDATERSRDRFLEEFTDDVENKKISKETTDIYIDIIKTFVKRLNKIEDSRFDKLAAGMDELTKETEDAAQDAPVKVKETTTPSAEKENTDENTDENTEKNKLEAEASDFSQEIDSVVDALMKIQKR